MTPVERPSFQAAFKQAVLDPDLPPPPGVVSHLSPSPGRRFAVYRNNVSVALVGALEARFPATRRIVGEEFFATMARVFAIETPPRTPVMMVYGDSFPDFIADFEPAASVPYLADVARLEAARTRAYHAADAEPLAQDVLAEALQAGADDLSFGLHPSLEIIASPFPIVTIWAMNSGEAELAPIADWNAEDALLLRPRLDVEVLSLPQGVACFLDLLARGTPLGTAAAQAQDGCPGLDLGRALAILLGSGLVVGVTREGTPSVE